MDRDNVALQIRYTIDYIDGWNDAIDAISEVGVAPMPDLTHGMLCDMEMFAAGRDLVTGDPLTMQHVQAIAARWIAAAATPERKALERA